MKRLSFFAAILLAVFTASCGGSGTTTTPPTTGNYSNASLSGTYAFLAAGQDGRVGDFIASIGSFQANGNGGITAALVDTADASAASAFTTTPYNGGSYSIQANGQGTITFTNSGGGTLELAITLNSTSQGLLSQIDGAATASGSLVKQNTGDFTIASNYVLSLSGQDYVNGAGNGLPAFLAGQIQTNGAGGITGGVLDVNDFGLNAATTNAITNGSGTYALDTNNSGVGPNGTTFGRGFLNLPGLNGVYYAVDHTEFLFLEEDTTSPARITVGNAVQQSAAGAPMQVSNWAAGNFAFILGSAGISGTNLVPVDRIGSFQTSGSGSLSNITTDDDNNGQHHSTTPSTGYTTTTYTIDTNFAGTGRGTITILPSGQSTPLSIVFYLVSATQGVLLDVSNNATGAGSLALQTSAPTAKNFAFNWSGANLVLGFEEDFVGQYSTNSTSSTNGIMNWVELASLGKDQIFLNGPIQQSGTLSGTGGSSYTVVSTSSPSHTYNFRAYTTSTGSVYLLCVDSDRVTEGIAVAQQ